MQGGVLQRLAVTLFIIMITLANVLSFATKTDLLQHLGYLTTTVTIVSVPVTSNKH